MRLMVGFLEENCPAVDMVGCGVVIWVGGCECEEYAGCIVVDDVDKIGCSLVLIVTTSLKLGGVYFVNLFTSIRGFQLSTYMCNYLLMLVS